MIKCKKLPVIAIRTVLTRATNSNLRQAGLTVMNTLNAITLAQLYPRLYSISLLKQLQFYITAFLGKKIPDFKSMIFFINFSLRIG